MKSHRQAKERSRKREAIQELQMERKKMTNREDRVNRRENKGKNKNEACTVTESKEVIVRFHGRSVVYHPYQLRYFTAATVKSPGRKMLHIKQYNL